MNGVSKCPDVVRCAGGWVCLGHHGSPNSDPQPVWVTLALDERKVIAVTTTALAGTIAAEEDFAEMLWWERLGDDGYGLRSERGRYEVRRFEVTA